jgi:tungstate transport system substrate-binding protein
LVNIIRGPVRGRRALTAAALALLASGAAAQERFIVLASTTSTEQSGLFGHILPAFRQATGIEVRVVALGTGQALDAARRGDADAVLVHDVAAEQKFVAEGYARERREVMYNDFVLVGPAADPARVAGRDIGTALTRLASSPAPFVSRGDRSGTHAAELRLWKRVNLDPAVNKPAGYRECGCGMGPALNMAAAVDGYVLADRGTWLAFRNRGTLKILVEGDRSLFNPYGVMTVSPARHPHVRHALAQTFADWLVSPAGQASISGYRIGGEQLFFPNAGK